MVLIHEGVYEFQIGLAEESYESAASLFDDAFEQELGAIVSSRDLRIAIYRDFLTPNTTVTALMDGVLTGLISFRQGRRRFASAEGAAKLIARLGWFRGLQATARLALLERPLADGELLMEGISVSRDWRGRGIGSGLLSKLISHARQHDIQHIRLSIIDSNPRARRFYRKMGFSSVKQTHRPRLRQRLGLPSSSEMILELEPLD